jgi:hypothetical protein
MFTKLHLYRAGARIAPALISNSHGCRPTQWVADRAGKTLLSIISAFCPFD